MTNVSKALELSFSRDLTDKLRLFKVVDQANIWFTVKRGSENCFPSNENVELCTRQE